VDRDTSVDHQRLPTPEVPTYSRQADKFFWTGSPAPTLVQRIAAWLIGGMLLGIGIGFAGFAREERSFLFVLVASTLILVGLIVFRNGFRRRAADRPAKPEKNGAGH
jgi:predicted lipid-binding transport protein (Tim44 family)